MIKTHHLNVGHGDTLVIEFCDTKRLMVIDMNRSSEFDDSSESEIINEALESVDDNFKVLYRIGIYDKKKLFETAGYKLKLTDPIDYIKALGYNHVFRFIQTHPHMDHLTGINALYESIPILNFWCHKNEFDQDESKLTDSQKNDWKLYKKFRDTNNTKIGATTVIRPYASHKRDFWNQDGITILSPDSNLIKLAQEKNNPNIMSTVLLIEHAGRKIVFGGDAEKETWEYIIENYEEEITNIDILDASHHGRDSGYHQPAVKIMNPDFVIVSVGKKPSTDASNKYRNYCDNVFSTRWKGNVVFTINDDGSGT